MNVPMNFEERVFQGLREVSDAEISGSEFSNCTFRSCDFNRHNLTGTRFTECTFHKCEFVGTKFTGVSFQEATFSSCRFGGVDFSRCEQLLLSIACTDSLLQNCVFTNMDLRRILMARNRIEDCDFTGCDMRGLVFDNTSLRGTRFTNCNLIKADFRQAHGYCFDPSKNKLTSALFRLPDCAGLLLPFDLKIEGFMDDDANQQE